MAFAQPTVIGLGEVLWDCFPEHRLPGGAPANVAFHAQQLGLTAAVATRVGVDPLGEELCAFLQSQGLSTALVQRDPLHATGTVTVEPRATGAKYTFLENSAWDFLEATPWWLDTLAHAQAVCFGTLAQRCPVSRATIQRCLDSVSDDCLVVYDINLRPPFFDAAGIVKSLAAATIVKLNDEEAHILQPLLGGPFGSEIEFARWLLTTYGLDAVCITRGANGAAVITPSNVFETPGLPVTVADTVGAGDAFTAALISARLAAWPWDQTLRLANQVGALVASRPGAMPVLRTEFAALQSSALAGFSETRGDL